jgi:phosphate-selective porin OprO/OprP
MVKASAFDQRLDLNLGLFDGAPDGSSLVQDFDNKKDVVARIFTHPFPEGSAGQGLGFGLAGSYGKHLGLARIYQTTTLQPFFKFAPNTLSDGISWRVVPQGYYYRGPFGLMAEYVTSSQEMALEQKRVRARNSAWQIMGNFVLTGEDASYRGVRPASDFEPGAGKFGALEFVMRAGRLSFDEEIFPEFADERLSARRASGFGAGLNWYLSRQVKFVFDYETTGFIPFTKPVAREHALITRMQFAYW